MRKKRKLLAILMAMSMVFTFMPAMVFADDGIVDPEKALAVSEGEQTEEYVAAVGDKEFVTLREAFIEAASVDETIVILSDINSENFSNATSKRITLGEGSYKLDLNGHTVAAGEQQAFNLYGTKLIIQDSSEEKTGVLKSSKTVTLYLRRSQNTEGPSAEVTVTGGTIENDGIAVYLTHASSFVLDGGDIKADIGIRIDNHGNGANVDIRSGSVQSTADYALINYGKNSKINVSGGELSSNNYAVYSAESTSLGSEVNISGGKMTGTTAIVLRYGNLLISEEDDTTVVNGHISLGFPNGTDTSATATFTGGKFKGEVFARNTADVSISGGTFEDELKTEGNGKISVTGGSFSTDVNEYISDDAVLATVCDSEGNIYYAAGEKMIQEAADKTDNAVVVTQGDMAFDAETTKAAVANDGDGIVTKGTEPVKTSKEVLAEMKKKADEDAEKIDALEKAKEEAEKAKAEAEKETEKVRSEAAKKEAAMAVKTVTVNTATVNAAAVDKAVAKAGGSEEYVKTIVLGKKVKKVKKNSFKKYTNAKTLVVKTKKLKKASVKKSLSGSKITNIRISVGKDKQNKTYLKKYKKIFTKKNAGKKVKKFYYMASK